LINPPKAKISKYSLLNKIKSVIETDLEILVFNPVEVVEIEVATVEIKPVADEIKGLKQCLLLMG
jgi:hypothetical protein